MVFQLIVVPMLRMVQKMPSHPHPSIVTGVAQTAAFLQGKSGKRSTMWGMYSNSLGLQAILTRPALSGDSANRGDLRQRVKMGVTTEKSQVVLHHKRRYP